MKQNIQQDNQQDKQRHKDLQTLRAIGRIYCSGNHAGRNRDEQGMCPDCAEAIEATFARSSNCPHGHVHNCEDCDTQCQQGEAKQRIKAIMRYAAPRMALRHPLMTLAYMRRKQAGR